MTVIGIVVLLAALLALLALCARLAGGTAGESPWRRSPCRRSGRAPPGLGRQAWFACAWIEAVNAANHVTNSYVASSHIVAVCNTPTADDPEHVREQRAVRALRAV